MKSKTLNFLAISACTAVLGVTSLDISVSATAAALTPKEKVAVSAYAKALSQSRANYFLAVKPARAAVIAIGKPAEVKRRTAVIAALVTYLKVVRNAKAPVFAAQAAYRIAASKSSANPTDASLKADAKSKLDALNKASAALKVDRNIAAARIEFSKARISAMAKFRATISAAVAKRTASDKLAFNKFRMAKASALVKFKAALKAAHSKITPK